MKTAYFVATVTVATFMLALHARAGRGQEASAVDKALKEQHTGWRFEFDLKEFLLTVKYYGPKSDRFITLTAGTDSHRELIETRSKEPNNIAFVATTDQILNWRAAMHPPSWRGGSVTSGVLKPGDDYVGYVVQIETAGKPLYSELGWQLETFDAIRSLNACCWKTRRNALAPMLEALSEQRRGWAQERYRSLLTDDWQRIVVSTGSGSCWGESCSPMLEIARQGKSVRVQKPGNGDRHGYLVPANAEEMAQLQRSLYRYAVHLELHGCCPMNHWKVYKIEMQKPPEGKMETVFYGYWAVFTPLDGKPFDQWIAESLKAK